jgi:hypothetical protein
LPNNSLIFDTPFAAEYTGRYAIGSVVISALGWTFTGNGDTYTCTILDPTITLFGSNIGGITAVVSVNANAPHPYTGANIDAPLERKKCAKPVILEFDTALDTGKYPIGNRNEGA